MKKTFLLFLTAVLVLGLTPSFMESESVSGADLLMKYHFITGDNGNPMVDKTITRAEVAVIVMEMNGVKAEAAQYTQSSGFTDVEQGMWYTPYIAYGEAKGYLGGYPDQTFRPEAAVSSKEFAAFMMNAMGYSGDYNYNDVLAFAAEKKVKVSIKGVTFLRGDAFDAMWEAVNQPSKGSDVAIGVKLGKLEASNNQSDQTPEEKPVTTGLVSDVVTKAPNAIEIKFKEVIVNPNQMAFTITRDSNIVHVQTAWNSAQTSAVLTSGIDFTKGTYEVMVSDSRSGTPVSSGPYEIVMEKEKVAKVVLASNTVIRYNDYFGTVGYRVFNQYDEDITNTDLARRLDFNTSTDHSKPDVDESTGTILIQHGSESQHANALKDLGNVMILITEPSTGFSFTGNLTVSPSSNAISEIRINGIRDENDHSVDLVYSPTTKYYLDFTLIDVNGNSVKSKKIFDQGGMGGQELLIVRSLNQSLIKITKTENPKRSEEVAYEITFVSQPTMDDLPITFTAIAPFALSGNNSATWTTTLKK